ncbi:acetylornithine aminotransferase [Nitzschia inconspicua]|uniref:acetylornithine transaminase n=1 Tax=Nitzschia inconspicua TaxID=303405 RepID=A0A9K3KUG7_9STRA|nr:acetylornithine aminotransferase [Nitzschia inconspicua]
MKLSVHFIVAIAVIPSASCFVPTAASRSTSSLKVSVGGTSQLTPPKKVEDLSDSSEELYNQNVQTTYGRYKLTIDSGKGCFLKTTDGKNYLDCVSGIATCALGHNNEFLTKAIENQMKKVHHVSNLYFIPEQAALANWLCTNSGADKAFFCNSGAEANEAAIKVARRYAYNRGIEKPVIISAEKSFHGRTLAALSATQQPKYHKGFGFGGEMVPGFDSCVYNDIASLEAAVERATSDGKGLAAIMLEPLQGEGGIIPGNPEFFAKARELCDKHGALLMIDEVQAGMGRTGTLWGHENLNVVPDVFTSAKALGGGVPIGAMMARGEAATTFGPGDHASTYGGNPLACAAGLAVAQYLYDNNVLENVQARGEQLSQGLEKLAEKYPTVLGQVRGWGLLKGVECIAEDITAGELVAAAMNEGLLLVPAGANVVRFVPPLIISEEEMNMALERFEAAVKSKAN